jgi:aryl carrier-like protein
VLAPKLSGAWNLHTLGAGLPLDFFVLFSSMASVLGSAGQANYAAANAFLDALAAYRRRQGRPALSVSWGPWTEGGMAASLAAHDRRRWDDKGVRALVPSEAVAELERVLAVEAPHVTIAAIDWDRYVSRLPTGSGHALSGLAECPAARATAAAPVTRPELLRQLDELPVARRSAAVLAHVREQVRRVLQLVPSSPLDPERGLKDLGLDSLMAVELRNRLQASTGRVLPSTLAFDHPTVAAIALHLERDVLGLAGLEPARAPATVGHAAVEADHAGADAVEGLSDDEAARLLVEELARVRESGREDNAGG